MIYKFKSKATGDVIMLGPNGDQMLRLIGREPSAKGIIEVEHMAAAIEALQAAVRAEEVQAEGDEADEGDASRRAGVSLRQRVWPVVDMLKRAQEARQPVVWGV
jgi:Domain of unknown function (DUF1840)